MERHPNGRVTRIGATEYASVLGDLKHVFLVGDLQKPSPHPFVRDDRLEVIVCSYQAGDDGLYHWHREVTEYELVTEGEVGYFEVGNGETHWFNMGDFIVIPAGVCVRRLVCQSAKTVAMKVPSSAEKVHCGQCRRVCAWRVEPYRGSECR